MERACELKTGKRVRIDYEKMFGCVPQVKPDKLVLDADQMLMILIYILLQAKVSFVKLYSHIRMIYEFQTDSQRNSQKGYCVSSMEICLESIFEEEPQASSVDEPDAAIDSAQNATKESVGTAQDIGIPVEAKEDSSVIFPL